MSLKPMAIPPVPAETARVAHIAFRKGNLYLKLRERLGTLVQDEDFVDLFAKEGAPGLPPWRVAKAVVDGWFTQLKLTAEEQRFTDALVKKRQGLATPMQRH